MKRNTIRTATVMLALMMLFQTFAFGATAYQPSGNIADLSGKSNFVLLSFDDNDDYYAITYTYEENGKEYKVVEEVAVDFGEVITQIYEMTLNCGFVLIDNYKTDINILVDSNVAITKIQNNKSITEVTELQNILPSSLIEAPPDTMNRAGIWQVVSIHNGSTAFESYTVGVVTALIMNVITAGMGSVASAVISTIVGAVVNNMIPTLWYTRTVQYWRESTSPTAPVTAVNVKTKYYYNSSRTSLADTIDVTYYGSFPYLIPGQTD